jgi:hypothetical protein
MSNQTRQPKGTDAGGQFASSTNPEAQVDLSTDAPSPYAEGGRRCVGDIKKLIENLPDDEPVLYWVCFREDAANKLGAISDVQEIMEDEPRFETTEISPEDWVKIYDRFEEESDSRHGPWSQLHEIFNESVLYVAQDDDDSPVRNMNRDDFCDLYQPITNPRSRESDQFEISMFLDYGEDLDFVRRQSSDYVWSRRRNKYNDTEIVNGYHPESEGYFVTLMPWSDEYDYVVSN